MLNCALLLWQHTFCKALPVSEQFGAPNFALYRTNMYNDKISKLHKQYIMGLISKQDVWILLLILNQDVIGDCHTGKHVYSNIFYKSLFFNIYLIRNGFEVKRVFLTCQGWYVNSSDVVLSCTHHHKCFELSKKQKLHFLWHWYQQWC